MKPPKFRQSLVATHVITTMGSDGVPRARFIVRGREVGRSKYDPCVEDKKHRDPKCEIDDK